MIWSRERPLDFRKFLYQVISDYIFIIMDML
jgi:hypothetical protein